MQQHTDEYIRAVFHPWNSQANEHAADYLEVLAVQVRSKRAIFENVAAARHEDGSVTYTLKVTTGYVRESGEKKSCSCSCSLH